MTNNDYDVPDRELNHQRMLDLLDAVSKAGCGEMVSVDFSVSGNALYFSNEDPLPPEMIMAAYRQMVGEVPESDLLTEEDELTEDLDKTLEDYFESSQFQADLFKMRWAV
jgi:hypothetical protein